MSALAALGLTFAVEVPLFGVALVAFRLAGVPRALLVGVGVNLITQPALWALLAPRPSLTRFFLAEAVVCVVEAGLLWLAVRREARLLLVLSVGTNAASVAVGLLVSAVAGG